MLRPPLVALAYFLFNAGVTHVPFYFFRHWYLRSVLRFSIGRGTSVHMGCFVTGRRIRIGRNSVINRNCHLDGRFSLDIGDNVSVSPECYLVTLGHDPQSSGFDAVPGPVTIGDRCWLGARAMVLPGTTLAEGTVVAAGAVVTRSTQPFEIVAGVPARKIGDRSRDLRYTLKYFPFFNSDIQP